MDIHARAEAAQAVARKVGQMLRHHGKLQVRAKADNDFVTEMDTKSEECIRGELLSRFPEDAFFGEEGGYGHRVTADRERTMRLLPELFERISDIRRYGSAAYALCCVACGRSEIFFELGLHIYDIAAGIVILEEAGGRATGWIPGEDCKVTGNILATNGHLHDFMVEQLNPRG